MITIPEMYTSELPELPEGWCWTCLDQLADVGTGATPKRGDPRYWSNGSVPWVTSGSLNQNIVSAPTEYVTPTALTETNLTVFPIGTLIVAMYGEGKTRGKCSELGIEASTNQAIAAAVVHGPDILKSCVKLFLQMNYEITRELASGGVQPNLNLSMIREIAIPLPPLAEQLALVSHVNAALHQLEALERTLGRTERLTMSIDRALLTKAFRGELVEQDPNDEPASAMLERLAAERQAAQEPPAASKRSPRQKARA